MVNTQDALTAANAALSGLPPNDPAYPGALAAVREAQTAFHNAQAAIPALQNAFTTTQANLLTATANRVTAENNYLTAQRTYKLAIDQANLTYAQTVSNIVVGNVQALQDAELERSRALYQAQYQLTVNGNALSTAMFATVSQAVADYGKAQGNTSRVMQLGMLQANGDQGVAMAQAKAAYQQAQALIQSTQGQTIIQSIFDWKQTEKNAAHQQSLDQALADEVQGQTTNDALSTQRLAMAAALLPWTVTTNSALEQLSTTTNAAGQAYSLALGLARNDWRSEMTLAGAGFNDGLTTAQNALGLSLAQDLVLWQETVVAAMAADVNAEAAAFGQWTSTEADAWSAARTFTAYTQFVVTSSWDSVEQTGWSEYQKAVALAWYNNILMAAPAESDLRIDMTASAVSFVTSYATDVQAAVVLQGANFLDAVALVNGTWIDFAHALNTAESNYTIDVNPVLQAYLITATNAEVTQNINIALADSAMALTGAVQTSTWTALENIAAGLLQSSVISAYQDLAVGLANATRDFYITEAAAAKTRDLADNAAKLTFDQAVVWVPADQQESQWISMWAYAPVQTSAAGTWADAVKQAAAYLKQGLNAAQANLLNDVAGFVAANEALARHIEAGTFVAVTTVRQAADIHKWQAQLDADLAAPLSEFVGVVAKLPQLVQTQLHSEANSWRDTSGWAVFEGWLNDLTGGRSRAILLSPEFTRALNAIDGFFAGVTDTLTAGISTKARAAMWGETATRNHTGGWFTLGQGVGAILTIPLMVANPCAYGALGNIGLRAFQGVQLIGNGISAVENILAGNYLAAGMNILSMLGNLSQMARACFTGDTKLMARGTWGQGWRRIDQITTDDEVLSRDENNPNGSLIWKKVEATFERWAFVHDLEVGGRTIGTTLEHPFYVAGKGWTEAGKLVISDCIPGMNARESVAVQGVRETGRYKKVYNLRVSEFSTYFVGSEEWGFSVWAHNASCDARMLGKRLEATERPRGIGEQAAHVVPTGAFTGRSAKVQAAIRDAQAILEAEGIGINSASNGFWATARHNGTHTDKFFLELGRRLNDARSAGTVRETLEAIRLEAKAGAFIR